MKTIIYNPSQLELDMANVLADLQPEIELRLNQVKITHIDKVTAIDNPLLVFRLEDSDGDLHELVVQIIQRPDNLPSLQKPRH